MTGTPRQFGIQRGFTLMESMMAVAILLVIVLAVTSAITAGQQNAYEAHQRIAGTLAGEELMGRVVTARYTDLLGWHGFKEPAGTMTTGDGDRYPETFDGVGRQVEVTAALEVLSSPAVTVRGRAVVVRAFDHDGRTLAELQRFIPEPPGG